MKDVVIQKRQRYLDILMLGIDGVMLNTLEEKLDYQRKTLSNDCIFLVEYGFMTKSSIRVNNNRRSSHIYHSIKTDITDEEFNQLRIASARFHESVNAKRKRRTTPMKSRGTHGQIGNKFIFNIDAMKDKVNETIRMDRAMRSKPKVYVGCTFAMV